MAALRQRSRVLYPLLLALLAVPLQACLVVISTEPTAVDEANIIVIVFDDQGALVSGVTVIVNGSGARWNDRGATDTEGVFRCRVSSAVTRVTVTLEPRPGYVLAPGSSWPVVLDLEPGGTERLELRVVRGR